MTLDGIVSPLGVRPRGFHLGMPLQQIADFLLGLFQEGKLKMSTIEGYKLAIVATLKPWGANVGSDPHLCGLVNSFYTDRPVERNLAPHWALVSGPGCAK